MAREWEHDVPDNPKNFCRECGRDFTSIEYFDKHFNFGETPEGGKDWDDITCKSDSELREIGMITDDNGRWYDPTRSQRAGEAFGA